MPPTAPVPISTPISRSTSRRDIPFATLRDSSSKKFAIVFSVTVIDRKVRL
jgi:hypothetical protein